MEITINVDALDKTAAAVVSASNRTPVTETELIVTGNRIPVTLRFCDDDGATPSWVTDAGVQIDMALGGMSVDGTDNYATTLNMPVVSTTRADSLNIGGGRLRTAVYNNLLCGNSPRSTQVPMVFEVRKTDADQNVETLLLLTIQVSIRVIPSSPSDDSQGTVLIPWVDVPATSSSSGSAGQVAYSTEHLYVCIATNTWRRTILNDWA